MSPGALAGNGAQPGLVSNGDGKDGAVGLRGAFDIVLLPFVAFGNQPSRAMAPNVGDLFGLEREGETVCTFVLVCGRGGSQLETGSSHQRYVANYARHLDINADWVDESHNTGPNPARSTNHAHGCLFKPIGNYKEANWSI